MNKQWNAVSPNTIKDNVFRLIGADWMLITSGTMDRWNTMTASWGGLGVLWGMDVSFCFVRDSRYTYEFMNDNDQFSLSFFDESQRAALNYCGSHSGRDVDKAAETGLVPVDLDGTVAFEQARMIMVCRKLYRQDIDPALFVDPTLDTHYAEKDYHRMYIGEITGCYAG